MRWPWAERSLGFSLTVLWRPPRMKRHSLKTKCLWISFNLFPSRILQIHFQVQLILVLSADSSDGPSSFYGERGNALTNRNVSPFTLRANTNFAHVCDRHSDPRQTFDLLMTNLVGSRVWRDILADCWLAKLSKPWNRIVHPLTVFDSGNPCVPIK